MTIKCHCENTLLCHCGATAITSSPHISGVFSLGWKPVIDGVGKVHYICPQCLPLLERAASLIVGYISPSVIVGNLLK